MRNRFFAVLACTAALSLSTTFAVAAEPQASMQMDKPGEPPASPPASAKVTLNGKDITIKYSSPRMRGRKIMGELVPYGEVWRVGANDATTLITPVNLKIGTLDVPAGTYSLFTLPNKDKWLFIVSKKTGEWGIPYPEGSDLGRTPMTGKSLSAPQENMSISFENTKGATTDLHVKWETTDQYVQITAK
jgi:hypothetical protein